MVRSPLNLTAKDPAPWSDRPSWRIRSPEDSGGRAAFETTMVDLTAIRSACQRSRFVSPPDVQRWRSLVRPWHMLVDEDRVPIGIEHHQACRTRRGLIRLGRHRETTLLERPLYVPNVVKVR